MVEFHVTRLAEMYRDIELHALEGLIAAGHVQQTDATDKYIQDLNEIDISLPADDINWPERPYDRDNL